MVVATGRVGSVKVRRYTDLHAAGVGTRGVSDRGMADRSAWTDVVPGTKREIDGAESAGDQKHTPSECGVAAGRVQSVEVTDMRDTHLHELQG